MRPHGVIQHRGYEKKQAAGEGSFFPGGFGAPADCDEGGKGSDGGKERDRGRGKITQASDPQAGADKEVIERCVCVVDVGRIADRCVNGLTVCESPCLVENLGIGIVEGVRGADAEQSPSDETVGHTKGAPDASMLRACVRRGNGR